MSDMKKRIKRAVPITDQVKAGTTGTIHHGKTHMHGTFLGSMSKVFTTFSFQGDGLQMSNVFNKEDWVFEPDVEPVELPTKVGAIVRLKQQHGVYHTLVLTQQYADTGSYVSNWKNLAYGAGFSTTRIMNEAAARGDIEVLFPGVDL